MIDYNLPSELRAELRKAKKWYSLGGALFVIGFFTRLIFALAGIFFLLRGGFVDFKANQRVKAWKKENGYA